MDCMGRPVMVIFYMISTFLGSILELCYIKYHIITNSVIKSLFCIESILTDITIKKKKKKKKMYRKWKAKQKEDKFLNFVLQFSPFRQGKIGGLNKFVHETLHGMFSSLRSSYG